MNLLNWIQLYVFFSSLLLSLCIIYIFKTTQVDALILMSQFIHYYCYKFSCNLLYGDGIIYLFICSSDDGQLGCFQIFGITDTGLTIVTSDSWCTCSKSFSQAYALAWSCSGQKMNIVSLCKILIYFESGYFSIYCHNSIIKFLLYYTLINNCFYQADHCESLSNDALMLLIIVSLIMNDVGQILCLFASFFVFSLLPKFFTCFTHFLQGCFIFIY